MKLTNIIKTAVLGALFFAASILYADYTIVGGEPFSGVVDTVELRLDFIDPLMSPTDSVTILYGTVTGGANPDNYSGYATSLGNITGSTSSLEDSLREIAYVIPEVDSNNPSLRHIYLKPNLQYDSVGNPAMRSGRFYFIVINKSGIRKSGEQFFIVESQISASLIAPKDSITSLTPVFSWGNVPGVPYYHLILSDEKIVINKDSSGDFVPEGLSIIWQIITPNNSIAYGQSDPSGIFAEAPPISPGVTYNWLVLNNYGNQKEYTSFAAIPDLPKEFTVKAPIGDMDANKINDGLMIKKEDGITVTKYDSIATERGILDTSKLILSWGSAGEDVNLYKVYAYTMLKESGLTALFVIWQAETKETEMLIDGSSIFNDSVDYVFKVFAENVSGVAISSDTIGFLFDVEGRGILKYKAFKSVGDTAYTISLADVSIQSLTGASSPLVFPTDLNGYGNQELIYGTYEVSVSKAGYTQVTKTLTVDENSDSIVNGFYLEAIPSQLYGLVKDSSGTVIPNASVIAINGIDTVRALADAVGSFSLYVNAGNWQIHSEIPSYQSSDVISVDINNDENRNIGTLSMVKFSYIISGLVTEKSTNSPLPVAKVILSRNGIGLDTIYTTDGLYSFSLEQGENYSLAISKPGYINYFEDSITVLSSTEKNFQLLASVVLVTGKTYVKTWIFDNALDNTGFYSISERSGVGVVAKVKGQSEIVSTAISSVNNKSYSISLERGEYDFYFSLDGTVANSAKTVNLMSVNSYSLFDTLSMFAEIEGFALADTDEKLSVNVTLKNALGNIIAVTTSLPASGGTYKFSGVEPGNYSLVFSKSAYVSFDTLITISDTSKRINADTLVAGTKTLSLSFLKSYDSQEAIIDVEMKSPFTQFYSTFPSTIQNLGAGEYYLGFSSSSNDNTIPISSRKTIISQSEVNSIIITLPLSLDTLTADSISLSDLDDSIEVTFNSFDLNIDSAEFVLFYKDRNSPSYDSVFSTKDTIIDLTKRFTFKFLVPQDNSTMNYYLRALRYTGTDSAEVFSNKTRPFNMYVGPSSRMKYVEVLPATSSSSPSIISKSGISEFFAVALKGDFTNFEDATYAWGIKKGIERISIVGSDNSSSVKIQVDADTSYIYELACTTATSSDTIVKIIYFQTFPELPNFYGIMVAPDVILNNYSVASGELTSFTFVSAYIEKSAITNIIVPFSTRATWKTIPDKINGEYLIDSVSGQFKCPSNYIGRIQIMAVLPDTIIYFLDSAGINEDAKGLNVRLNAGPGRISSAASVFVYTINEFNIRTTANSFASDAIISIGLDRNPPSLKSFTLENKVISNIYNIKEANNASVKDTVYLTFKIPEGYQDEDLSLMHWNRRKVRWETPEQFGAVLNFPRTLAKASFRSDSIGEESFNGDYLTLALSKIIYDGDETFGADYAITVKSQELGIYDLKVGPTPFSPYVTCTDFVNKLGDTESSWQGLRIEFNVSSRNSANVTTMVKVYNMKGQLVRNVPHLYVGNNKPLQDTKGGLSGSPSGTRYLIWDGRNDMGRMCNNGRYLIRIDASDLIGQDNYKNKSIPVVLFK